MYHNAARKEASKMSQSEIEALRKMAEWVKKIEQSHKR